MQYESIQLFVERASAARPEFFLTEEKAGTVAHICQRLDGIPLAIELAAARVRMMSLEQIAARLDDRFRLLTTSERAAQPRHQTLRAAVDWSYELLSEKERQLFCRLSVFAGGWTLEAAETICAGKGLEKVEILDLLARLVDKSLVIVTPDGERYRMLETIRQYGKEKLVEAGMDDWMIERHLDYFTNLAETADEKIRGPEQFVWLEWLEAERDNLMAAMKRSLTTPSRADLGGRLVSALCWYWYSVGDFIQLKRWLESTLQQSSHMGRTATRAKILFNAGAFSALRVQWLKPVEARTALEESLEIWRELGSAYTLEAAQSLLFLGYIQKHRFDDEKGIDFVCESIETFKLLDNHWWHAWGVSHNAILARRGSKDYLFLRKMLKDEASLWNKTGDRHGEAHVLFDMGLLELDHGKFVEAERYFKRSLEIYKEFKAIGFLQRLMKRLGDAATGLKKYDQALEYYEVSAQLAHKIGWSDYITGVYEGLGYAALHMMDDQGAEEYFHQSLKIDKEMDHKPNLAYCLLCFACLAAYRGDSINAVRLFGAFYASIEALEAASGLTQKLIDPLDQLEIDHYMALCQAQLDKATFDQFYNAGRLLSLDEAIDEILQARGEKIILES
jgi:tetratricopeptide (TPR) repeat protein